MPWYKLTVIAGHSLKNEEEVGEPFLAHSPTEAKRICRGRATAHINATASKKVRVFAVFEQQWVGCRYRYREIGAFLAGERL